MEIYYNIIFTFILTYSLRLVIYLGKETYKRLQMILCFINYYI